MGSKDKSWLFLPWNSDFLRGDFDCGEEKLNQYIKQQANQDVERNLSRVFVLVAASAPEKILGYYTLSAGSVGLLDFPENFQKKLPKYPIPVARIGRLAVDKSLQGKGLGMALLVHALKKSVQVASEIGILSVIVDAKSIKAKIFYEKYGFQSFPSQELKLFIPIKTLIQAFTENQLK